MEAIKSRVKKLERLLEPKSEFEIPTNIKEMKGPEIDELWDKYIAHVKKNNMIQSIRSEMLSSKSLSDEEIGLLRNCLNQASKEDQMD